MQRIPFHFASLPFFSQSYSPPRDLHSFPTRRSSDLGGRGSLGGHAAHPRERLARSTGPDRAQRDPGRQGAASIRSAGSDPQARRDRKSTRLNSSHVKISYAVFCLKKKKKKIQHAEQ